MRRSLIASPFPPLPAEGRKGLAGHCLLGAGRGWRQRPFSRRPLAAVAPRRNWWRPGTAGSPGTESWAAVAGLQPCALGCMLLLPGGAGRQAPQPAGAVCMEKSGCSPFPMCWAKGTRDLRCFIFLSLFNLTFYHLWAFPFPFSTFFACKYPSFLLECFITYEYPPSLFRSMPTCAVRTGSHLDFLSSGKCNIFLYAFKNHCTELCRFPFWRLHDFGFNALKHWVWFCCHVSFGRNF